MFDWSERREAGGRPRRTGHRRRDGRDHRAKRRGHGVREATERTGSIGHSGGDGGVRGEGQARRDGLQPVAGYARHPPRWDVPRYAPHAAWHAGARLGQDHHVLLDCRIPRSCAPVALRGGQRSNRCARPLRRPRGDPRRCNGQRHRSRLFQVTATTTALHRSVPRPSGPACRPVGSATQSEIGALVAYLASPEAAYMSGQVVSPNGSFNYCIHTGD